MIGKIIGLIALVILSIFAVPQIFSFKDKVDSSLNQNIEKNISSQISNITTIPTIPLLNIPLNPKDWLSVGSNYIWDLVEKFAGYITDYFKKVFPKSTNTFGVLIVLLTILFILWLLANKFENVFRAILLVGILVTVVFLIMSAIGFI